MSRTVDPGLFFQTEQSLEETQRKSLKSKNKAGNPIKLSSKILAVLADPDDAQVIYVAESAATVRRVNLDTRQTSQVYRGPSAPLTCLTISLDHRILLAGCWDKTIWSWNLATREPATRYIGHADFVKAIICTRLVSSPALSTGKPDSSLETILISGSADATIIVWSLADSTKLHVLKGHTRGILDLATDPSSFDHASHAKQAHSFTLFSAGSDREIRRWHVALNEAHEIDAAAPLLLHETSVNKLCFTGEDGTGEGAEEAIELWTASSDKSAKCSSRSTAATSAGTNGEVMGEVWAEDTELVHPDFVRDLVVDDIGGLVVTACRDEEVRVWDRASAELVHIYSGHYEEVTGLIVIGKANDRRAVSVSIDGTIRQWSLSKEDLTMAKAEAEKKQHVLVEEAPDESKGKSILTEEEERELAELMDDD